MTEPTPLHIELLRQIRDEIRVSRTELKHEIAETNQRLDVTNQRLDVTNQRLDVTNQRLGQVEGAIGELAEQQSFVVRWLRASTTRDRDIERDVASLTTRVDRLEARLGPDDRTG